jgi:hypothetical protein
MTKRDKKTTHQNLLDAIKRIKMELSQVKP